MFASSPTESRIHSESSPDMLTVRENTKKKIKKRFFLLSQLRLLFLVKLWKEEKIMAGGGNINLHYTLNMAEN